MSRIPNRRRLLPLAAAAATAAGAAAGLAPTAANADHTAAFGAVKVESNRVTIQETAGGAHVHVYAAKAWDQYAFPQMIVLSNLPLFTPRNDTPCTISEPALAPPYRFMAVCTNAFASVDVNVHGGAGADVISLEGTEGIRFWAYGRGGKDSITGHVNTADFVYGGGGADSINVAQRPTPSTFAVTDYVDCGSGDAASDGVLLNSNDARVHCKATEPNRDSLSFK